MKTAKKILVAVLLSASAPFVTASAEAVTNDSAFVSVIRFDASGKGIIYFDHDLGNVDLPLQPTCRAAGQLGAVAFDGNTKGGEAIARVALAAQLAGKRVKVVGKGSCNLYGNTEDVDALYAL